MGSNPCRIILLLGIAHLVKGKIISGTTGSPSQRDPREMRRHRRRVFKRMFVCLKACVSYGPGWMFFED